MHKILSLNSPLYLSWVESCQKVQLIQMISVDGAAHRAPLAIAKGNVASLSLEIGSLTLILTLLIRHCFVQQTLKHTPHSL